MNPITGIITTSGCLQYLKHSTAKQISIPHPTPLAKASYHTSLNLLFTVVNVSISIDEKLATIQQNIQGVADFLDTEKISIEMTLEKSKLKGFDRLIAEALKVFSPLF